MAANQDAIGYLFQNVGINANERIPSKEGYGYLTENVGINVDTEFINDTFFRASPAWGISLVAGEAVERRYKQYGTGYLYEHTIPDLPVGSYYDMIMATNPLAYWRMDDLSGTVLTDASGNGHHGTIGGTGTFVDYGQPGVLAGDSNPSIYLREFASNSFLRVPYGSWMNLQNFAAIGWFIPDENINGTEYLFTRARSPSISSAWMIRFGSSNSIVAYVRLDNVDRVITVPNASLDVNDGAPHMIALTYDSSRIRLYLDGEEIGHLDYVGTVDPGVNTEIRIGHIMGGSNGEQVMGIKDEYSFGPWVDGDYIQQLYYKGITGA